MSVFSQTPPVIITQPANQSVQPGVNVAFTVLVQSGLGPFEYQWIVHGTNFPLYFNTIAGDAVSGYSGDFGIATQAELNQPTGVIYTGQGGFLIADSGNSRLREVDANGLIETVAGNGTNFGATQFLNISNKLGDGGNPLSAYILPQGSMALGNGYSPLYFGDYGDFIREINPFLGGPIKVVAGNETNQMFIGDGGAPTNAWLGGVTGVALDLQENLLIAEPLLHSIRKIDFFANTITTIAGTSVWYDGTNAFSGDGGPATSASLVKPGAIAVDTDGNIFVADYNRIRKIDAHTSVIDTVAGGGTNNDYFGTFIATNVSLSQPLAILPDLFGNLYIADSGGVWRLDPYNNIKRLAGGGGENVSIVNGIPVISPSDGGVGTALNASISDPGGLTLDSSGNLIVSDTYNNRILKFFVAGAPNLGITNVGPNDVGTYQVVVSNPYGSVTSSIVNLSLSISPLVMSLSKVSVINSKVSFLVSGPPGSNYVLQVSTNLSNWSTVTTSVIPASGSISLTNGTGGSKQQFYRVQLE
jgi:hypothetical protein